MQETGLRSLGQEDPLGQEMATHSEFLPGESQGQRSLAGYSSQSRRVWRDRGTEHIRTLKGKLSSGLQFA